MAAVIFDLDGTLADTSGDLIAAANLCLLGSGVALDPAADAATAFRGGRALLRRGHGRAGLKGEALEAAVEAGYQPFLEAYGAALDVHTQLYPGVEEALDRLAAQGHGLAICTNKPEGLAETLMQRLGLRDRFAGLIGADTLPVRKPDPAPLRAAVETTGVAGPVVLIGDTVTDRETARAFGCASVLVTFGPEGRAVGDLAPEALLDSYADLPELIERLFSSAH